MSIVRSESLLDTILSSNSVVLDANKPNTPSSTPTPSTNSATTILSPDPTEESIALSNRNNNKVDVSSFDTLADKSQSSEWDNCSTKGTTQAPQIKSKRDKIQSFIEFDDDDDAAGSSKNAQDRSGKGGKRSFTNGKSFDYSYCDNVELADVFSVPNATTNNEEFDTQTNKLTHKPDSSKPDDVEWAQFQSSQPQIDSDASENMSDDADTENNDDNETFEGDDNVYTKLEKLEAEQEILNNSLLALTSHFAKVQFRIKQIVNNGEDMKQEQREILLKDLETFANRGIPELMSSSMLHHSTSGCGSVATSVGKLERTTSMATSLMADDVFDDLETDAEDNDGGIVTEAKLERQRSRQKELIDKLKDQLEDLERYAYETGDISDLPSSMLLERQNVIIEQLKSKLPVLTIDEIDKLSPEQLRARVDKAVRELVSPVLMKEQLVSQLKTQVTDLERFIEFLQKAHGKKIKNGMLESGIRSKMSQFLKLKRQQDSMKSENNVKSERKASSSSSNAKPGTAKSSNNINSKSKINTERATTPHANHANIIRRIISLLQVFAWTQIGSCTNFPKYPQSTVPRSYRPPFEKNSLKRQTRHFGDLRAHLEMSIDRLIQFYNDKTKHTETNGDASSSGEDFISLGDTKLVINNYFLYEQMNIIVRKDFAIALRNLIQHGLKGAVCDDDCDPNVNGHRAPSTHVSGSSGTLAPAATNASLFALGLGCFGLSGRTPAMNLTPISSAQPSHAWEVILHYYNLKNGARLRSDSSRRLSQSFGLQVVTGMNIANPKHSLLVAIDDIIDSHTRLKRSLDAHFKAFVCVALNQKMLSQWLRLIVRNSRIISDCYERWSYASSTGFEDALRQMDKLASLKFCLPTDIAVRQLQSIHDAF